MHLNHKLIGIRHEIEEQFELPEGELPRDVWDRYLKLTLLKDAHRNRKIMHLTLAECEDLDAEATSMADKPNYVKRWLLWHTIKEVLGIQDTDLNMAKELLFIEDTPKIIKAIKDNEFAYRLWGFIEPEWDYKNYPFRTIKKILKERLDLDVVYAGHQSENGSEEEQDAIIDYYKKQQIYQSIFGIGKGGWTQQLKSREKRWKGAKAHIDFLIGWKGVSFNKLEKAQQTYYLSYTPHLKIQKWKYQWKGKNIGREIGELLIINYRRPLALPGINRLQRGLDIAPNHSEIANDY